MVLFYIDSKWLQGLKKSNWQRYVGYIIFRRLPTESYATILPLLSICLVLSPEIPEVQAHVTVLLILTEISQLSDF